MRVGHCTLLAAVLAAGLSACAASEVLVLCTTTIVGDVVRRIAGDEAQVAILLPIGADPHSFQPAPRDAMAVAAADIVFLNGAGLEAPLVPILQGARGEVIDLSSSLALREHEVEGTGTDPHVWFNPLYVIEWANAIAGVLGQADPEHASVFVGRAEAYSDELRALDVWIRERISAVPSEARRIVSDHEALGYYALRYGLEEIGTIISGFSTLSEPSAHELALLEDAIRATGARCVFVGTTVPAALAEQVSADTGARIVFLYTGSLSEATGPAGTYLDLMRFDTDQIVAGLLGSL